MIGGQILGRELRGGGGGACHSNIELFLSLVKAERDLMVTTGPGVPRLCIYLIGDIKALHVPGVKRWCALYVPNL